MKCEIPRNSFEPKKPPNSIAQHREYLIIILSIVELERGALSLCIIIIILSQSIKSGSDNQ